MTGAPTTSPSAVFLTHFSPERLRAHIDGFIDHHRDPLRDGRLSVPRGYDRLPVEWLDRTNKIGITNRELLVTEISRKVLNGTYVFGPALERVLSSGTKQRSVWRSALRDQIVQYVLCRVLEDLYDARFANCSYGFRKGRSYHDAVRHLNASLESGRTVIFEADIESFFDTITHDTVLRCAARLCRRCGPLMDLIREYIRSSKIPAGSVRAALRRSRQKPVRDLAEPRDLGVPQGGAVSGIIANLVLHSFDRHLVKLGYDLIRYADDFVICCTDSTQALRVRRKVAAMLRRRGLRLHDDPAKTRVVPIADGLDFLGYQIRGPNHVRVKTSNVTKWRQRIDQLLGCIRRVGSDERLLSYMIGRVNLRIEGYEGRNWVSAFKLCTSDAQFRTLDRWLWRRVATRYRQLTGKQIKYSDLKRAGLKSLVREYYRTRASLQRRV